MIVPPVSFIDEVLHYAERGWAPFLLGERSKRPLLSGCKDHKGVPPEVAGCTKDGHGHLDATTDPDKLKWWWHRHPRANIGINLQRSGLSAVDCDPRHWGHLVAEQVLTEAGVEDWDDTVLQFSGGKPCNGGKGWHRIHLAPPSDVHLRQPFTEDKQYTDGLSLLTTGYLVVWPSVHPDGGEYIFEASSHPFEMEVAPLSQWIIDRQRDDRPVRDFTIDENRIIRWRPGFECFVCGGHQRMRQGISRRCWGYLDSTREYARCTRPEYAGPIPQNADGTYSHYLFGDCRCGRSHDPFPAEAEVLGGRMSVIGGGGSSNGPAPAAVAAEPAVAPAATPASPAVTWPEPPEDEAYHGFAGEVVEAVDPDTEADPVAVLLHLLVAFGSAVGRGPHAMVGATRHSTNLFAAVVGKSAKSRKGAAWSPIRYLFAHAYPEWADTRIMGGLSSGEGLISEVRDRVTRTVETVDKKTGETVATLVVEDEGVADKRLLAVEPELARVLKVISGREGNTLSSIARQAWDDGSLRTMTRKNGLVATGAHISIMGHITAAELHRELTEVEVANGFANRFLWTCVRRSKLLPSPEPFGGPGIAHLVSRLRSAIEVARRIDLVQRDDAAERLWADEYEALSADRDGMYGSLTARAEPQTVRLAMLYALLDGSALVRAEHLRAAFALWRYCERSLEFLFGNATGDPVADTILRALTERKEMTKGQLYDVLGRHVPKSQLDPALQALDDAGRVVKQQQATGGRPREVWSLR